MHDETGLQLNFTYLYVYTQIFYKPIYQRALAMFLGVAALCYLHYGLRLLLRHLVINVIFSMTRHHNFTQPKPEPLV